MNKVIITVPAIGDHRFKQWAKILAAVDTSKANGFAFEGGFVPVNDLAELEVGSLLLCYGETGSHEHRRVCVDIYQATPSSTLDCVMSRTDLSGLWALAIRDEVAELLQGNDQADADDGPISAISVEFLRNILANLHPDDAISRRWEIIRGGVAIGIIKNEQARWY